MPIDSVNPSLRTAGWRSRLTHLPHPAADRAAQARTTELDGLGPDWTADRRAKPVEHRPCRNLSFGVARLSGCAARPARGAADEHSRPQATRGLEWQTGVPNRLGCWARSWTHCAGRAG